MQPPFSCCVGQGLPLSVGMKGETCIRRGFILGVGAMLVRGQPKGCPYITRIRWFGDESRVGTGFTLSVGMKGEPLP